MFLLLVADQHLLGQTHRDFSRPGMLSSTEDFGRTDRITFRLHPAQKKAPIIAYQVQGTRYVLRGRVK